MLPAILLNKNTWRNFKYWQYTKRREKLHSSSVGYKPCKTNSYISSGSCLFLEKDHKLYIEMNLMIYHS